MKKIAASVLLVLVIIGFSFNFPKPKEAHALFGIDFCGMLLICPDPVSDGAEISSGISNATTAGTTTVTAGSTTAKLVIDGTPAERAITDTFLSTQACDAYANTNNLLDIIDTVGGSLAGADQTNISNTFFLSSKVASLEGQLNGCWNILEAISNNVHAGISNSQSTNLEHNKEIIATKKQTIITQLDNYRQQQKTAFSDVFKAIGVNFILSANASLTKKGLDELQEKYNIKQYADYADVLAGAYTIDYIHKHYNGNAERELIAASLFQNDAIADLTKLKVAQTAAQQLANKYTVNAASLDWSSPDYWSKVAMAANEEVWPDYHMINGRQDVQQAKAVANSAASNEIQNGNGSKSTRTCVDVTSTRSTIDAKVQSASQAVETAELNLHLAQMAYSEESLDSKTNLTNATSKYNEAKAAYDALIKEQSVGGFIPQACKAITQTASFVTDTTSKLLGQWLGASTTINDANIPLYGKILGNLFDDIFNNILNGKKGGEVLQEGIRGGVNVGITAGLDALIRSTNQSSQVPATVNTPTVPPTTTTYNATPAAGTVAGAYTSVPTTTVFMPRGPEPAFRPLGPSW